MIGPPLRREPQHLCGAALAVSGPGDPDPRAAPLRSPEPAYPAPAGTAAATAVLDRTRGGSGRRQGEVPRAETHARERESEVLDKSLVRELAGAGLAQTPMRPAARVVSCHSRACRSGPSRTSRRD